MLEQEKSYNITVNIVKTTSVKIVAEVSPVDKNIQYRAKITARGRTYAIPVIPTLVKVSKNSIDGATDFLLELYQKGYKLFDFVKYRSFGLLDGIVDVSPSLVPSTAKRVKGRGLMINILTI